jgi:hypothetical protein
MLCAAQATPAPFSLSSPFMSTFNRFCIGSAFSIAVAGVSCFAALMHDVTGPQDYSARTVSNLALAALVLPGAAVLPLAAASRKSA